MDKEVVVYIYIYIQLNITQPLKKKNGMIQFAETWMDDVEIVILSELSQTEKDKYYKTFFICGI